MGIENGKDSENAKEAETRKFYDVHCHAFNWSHLNVLVFLKRFKIKLLLPAGPLVWLYNKCFPDTSRKFLNLLSLLENDLGNYFLLTEYFLKNVEPKVVSPDNTFTIGDVTYKKIVLTPLIMDYGYRNIELPGIFYNIPPRKPIRSQVIDVFNGIKFYCENKLVPKDGKLKSYEDKECGKDNKLFEIYPFLGLNTKHYTDEKVERMLVKYFKDYKGKQQPLYENMGEFNGDIEGIGSNFFAGIKVYPPLGFDPWPDNGKEKDKVIILYDHCIKKSIPITTHCSNGGFRVDENADNYTAPGLKWTEVLKKYPKLKINFGHFGYQSKRLWLFPRTQWRDSIIELMSKYPNVYADFSCLSLSEQECKHLEDLIEEKKTSNHELKDRIFFGSDFLISLIWTDSYNKYLSNFITTQYLQSLKENFCSKNPEKFLFNQKDSE
ncbi:MAG: amidohydrolase family protein [Candidatus Scalindua sp.]